MNDLFLTTYVMNTDEDCSIVQDIFIGYNNKLSLIIRLEQSDYTNDEQCHLDLVVKKEAAYRLSQRLKVSMVQLPERLWREVSDYGDIINADFSDAASCLCDLRDFIERYGCRYKVKRKPANKDFYHWIV
ncbi:MAG: hypothetical protein J1F05_02085 [Muribaculaceae bacterium]|nr:hypothetical protein [Muribaculaceae bacterium]